MKGTAFGILTCLVCIFFALMGMGDGAILIIFFVSAFIGYCGLMVDWRNEEDESKPEQKPCEDTHEEKDEK